ncbi:unnamed protein product [Nippostrongylus brasiliensis]|uniref:proline--tRNA ligase n=1 Tax=Nippostrongylus brasiliensis TaxID=27835 RepID=A0A0N4YCH1_NIPBR|nr:unnamed protein product [Nippostrongylus brasiliensis]
MESIGAMKTNMPILGSRVLWEKASRWNSMGAELLTTTDRHDVEWCLQPTAEEMCTQLVAQLPALKKRMFPLLLYQTSQKFRDEMNPRFGLLRARQFLMKDLYSFDVSAESASETYETVCSVYDRIFRDILGLETYKVSAQPGVHGGSQSHEYHLRNPLEEDKIQYCSRCHKGKKVEDGPLSCACGDGSSVSTFSTIEVGHTFQLGTKYSQALGAFTPEKSPLEMCCFGIGVTRLLPAIVELLAGREETIRLPPVIAPFSAAVIVSRQLLPNVLTELTLSSLHRHLGGGILLDDRVEDNIGKRIKSLQEIGIPRIVVLGKTTQETMNKVARVEYIAPQKGNELEWENRELSLNEMMQAIG